MTFKHEARRPSTVWTLVADRARARLFVAEWPDLAEFLEIRGVAHPKGAARRRDVEADGFGRFSESGGPQHAGEQETDFKHKTATQFARQIVQLLQEGKDSHAYGRLIIIAPALLLGVLREQLPDPVKRLVVVDLDKDLTQARAETIHAHVDGLIAAGNQV